MERSRNIELTEQCTGETSADEKGWQEEGKRVGLKVLKMAHFESSAESLSVHKRKIWKKTS